VRAEAALTRSLEPWRDKYPDVVAEHELSGGDPATVLVDATAHADLIVVGARRRGGGVRLGPIAHTLLRHADCSVAVVPYT